MNTAATIATTIATRMTITLRRDLGGRKAAVNRSLLPIMESCSPGFAGSRWIWSKEIVSFSDDAISDEISRHGFTSLLRCCGKSYWREKIARQIIPFIQSFSLWSWKVNTATIAILKVCSSRWLEFQFRNCWWFSHAWYFMHKRDLNLDCSSHMLLLSISNTIGTCFFSFSRENCWLAVFLVFPFSQEGGGAQKNVLAKTVND